MLVDEALSLQLSPMARTLLPLAVSSGHNVALLARLDAIRISDGSE
jgi:hypothetical protein